MIDEREKLKLSKEDRVLVLGASGLVGYNLSKTLIEKGFQNLILQIHKKPLRKDLIELEKEVSFKVYRADLTDYEETKRLFFLSKPNYVFFSSALVGGVFANNVYRKDFLEKNLLISLNVIRLVAKLDSLKGLIYYGSTCIYPKSKQKKPKETDLFSSEFEYTNEPYSIAKATSLRLIEQYVICEEKNFINLMPTNLFGIGDNFDLETAHVIAALIRKMILTKFLLEEKYDLIRKDLNFSANTTKEEIEKYLSRFGIEKDRLTIWASGREKRDFLSAKKLSEISIKIAQDYTVFDLIENFFNFEIKKPLIEYVKEGLELKNFHVNVGCNKPLFISYIVETIKNSLDYRGRIVFDSSKRKGVVEKSTDIERLSHLIDSNLIKYNFEAEIKSVISDYLRQLS